MPAPAAVTEKPPDADAMVAIPLHVSLSANVPLYPCSETPTLCDCSTAVNETVVGLSVITELGGELGLVFITASLPGDTRRVAAPVMVRSGTVDAPLQLAIGGKTTTDAGVTTVDPSLLRTCGEER